MRYPPFRSRAFSLVELLVVIAIIGILISMTMPAMSRSREVAREIRCMANMRQVYTMAAAFRADQNCIMPNSWFANYPDGFNSRDYGLNGGLYAPADRGSQNSYSHLLILKGYAPDTRGSNYIKAEAAGKNGVFFCPSMFTKLRDDYWDTRSWAGSGKITDDIQRRSAPYGYDYYYEPGNFVNKLILNGYQVNETAGGSGYYYTMNGLPNAGFYKRKHWKSQAEDRIGYLFENFHWTTGGVFQYVDAVTLPNYGAGGYGPPIRHNAYTSTNLLYADGHAIKFPTPAYPDAESINNPVQPVSFLFE